MAEEQLCPVCGCTVVEGYKKEGVVYCCEPYAAGGVCACGCCAIEEEIEGE